MSNSSPSPHSAAPLPQSILVPAKPIPLKRHRMGSKRAYDPQVKEKTAFALFVQNLWGLKPLETPVVLTCVFAFGFPKKTSLKKKRALENKPRDKKPDLDNLIKFVMDALNGVVWKDDAIICKIIAKKIHSPVEYTEITIDAAE